MESIREMVASTRLEEPMVAEMESPNCSELEWLVREAVLLKERIEPLKKDLEKTMVMLKEGMLNTATAKLSVQDGERTILASLVEAQDTKIEVEKFYKLVPLKKFLQAVSVSVRMAERFLGREQIEQIANFVPKEPYVKLTVAKRMVETGGLGADQQLEAIDDGAVLRLEN